MKLKMEKWSCAECGVVTKMPKETLDRLVENHNIFHCIHGHENMFPDENNIGRIEEALNESNLTKRFVKSIMERLLKYN